MKIIEQCDNELKLEKANPRKVFAKFATGVCIIIINGENGLYKGLTVNSFSSLSLNPLLISFSIKTSSHFYPLFNGSKKNFSVNILQSDQIELSKMCTMAGGANLTSRDVGSAGGSFFLRGSLACLTCSLYQQFVAGDHTIFAGEVKEMLCRNAGDPLIFYNGKYSFM